MKKKKTKAKLSIANKRKKASRNSRKPADEIVLYANPYDTSKKGWYFKSADEFDEKYEKHLPTEEYEIEFIDGTKAQAQLFDAMHVSQANVGKWFKIMDEVTSEHDQAALYYLLAHYDSRMDWDEALRLVEDEVRVHEGNEKSYVEDYIDSAGGVAEAFSKDVIERYFDYEQFGRDIAMDLDPDEEGDAYYLEMSDQERGEAYVDDIGFDSLGKTVENYLDVEALARDMGYNGEIHEFEFAGSTWTTDYQG